MINLTGIINMIFKGKERRDSDVALINAMPRKELSVIDLANDPDNVEWTGAKFWVVVNDNLVDVHGATYTGLVLPNGVAQWAIFSNIHGVICHMGYVWDDTRVYVTYEEYKPIKGAWALYQEMAS